MASRIAAQWSSLSHVHFRWTAEGWKVAKNIKALLGVTFRKIPCLHTLTRFQIGKSSSTNHNSLATLFTFTYLYYPLLVGCVDWGQQAQPRHLLVRPCHWDHQVLESLCRCQGKPRATWCWTWNFMWTWTKNEKNDKNRDWRHPSQ
jgi:hypothetical protein